MTAVRGRALVAGVARGKALVTDEPLSFWGGFDPATGEITDRRHPLSGRVATGRILVMPFTRGSSTTTAILLESIRVGTAPAAIVTERPDSFLALASIVADEMYTETVPVLVVSPVDFGRFESGVELEIRADGSILDVRAG